MNSKVPPRYNSPAIKDFRPIKDPCGDISRVTSTKTNIKTILDLNQNKVVTLTWKETIDHPGHFIFDFSEKNNNFNPVQVIVNDNTSYLTQSVQFTLPSLTGTRCENCTIRMRQTMFMPSPTEANYDPTTDARIRPYYSCADIAIVDKTLIAVPELVSGIQAVPVDTTNLTLSWADMAGTTISEVVIVRKELPNQASLMNQTLTNFIHYPVGTSIGNDPASIVVYRGNETSFKDNGLSPETSYGYKVFARNTNYNYNQGTVAYFNTAADAGTTPPPPATGGTEPGGVGNTGSADTSSSAGGIFGMLLLLLGITVVRYYFTAQGRR
ncbi:MAG: hypothetical protein ACC707_03710 [Thiohalomonadales bacterium]